MILKKCLTLISIIFTFFKRFLLCFFLKNLLIDKTHRRAYSLISVLSGVAYIYIFIHYLIDEFSFFQSLFFSTIGGYIIFRLADYLLITIINFKTKKNEIKQHIAKKYCFNSFL